MNKVYCGLGSNVGDSIENINKAIQFFLWDNRFKNLEVSSLYKTKPYGKIIQENFTNAVISFETKVSPVSIFNLTRELEARIGRINREDWGPREIDIDILLYGDEIIENEQLSIPHIDLLNRDFVIVPLLEINEDIVHPVEKKKIKLFLSDLKDKYIIDKINFSLTEQ